MLRARPPTSAGRIAEVEPGRRREKASRASPSGASVQRRGEREREALPDRPVAGPTGTPATLGSAPPPEHQEWPELVPWLPCLDSSAAAAREMESPAVLYLWLVWSVVVAASARGRSFYSVCLHPRWSLRFPDTTGSVSLVVVGGCYGFVMTDG